MNMAAGRFVEAVKETMEPAVASLTSPPIDNESLGRTVNVASATAETFHAGMIDPSYDTLTSRV